MQSAISRHVDIILGNFPSVLVFIFFFTKIFHVRSSHHGDPTSWMWVSHWFCYPTANDSKNTLILMSPTRYRDCGNFFFWELSCNVVMNNSTYTNFQVAHSFFFVRQSFWLPFRSTGHSNGEIVGAFLSQLLYDTDHLSSLGAHNDGLMFHLSSSISVGVTTDIDGIRKKKMAAGSISVIRITDMANIYQSFRPLQLQSIRRKQTAAIVW